MTRITTGFKELEAYMRRLPQSSAQSLQNKVIANHIEHRDEVIRSSDMSQEAKKNMKFAIRVFPGSGGSSGKRTRVTVNRLQDVTGETVSFWKGLHTDDPAKGTAAMVEKTIGSGVTKPLKRRYLVIPQGPFATSSGRPRRRKVNGRMIPYDISEQKNTRIVIIKGRRYIVQRLAGGSGDEVETKAAKEQKIKLGTRKKFGERERIIGVQVKQAKGFKGLDFFGAWERLASKRTARYDALLDDMVKGKT